MTLPETTRAEKTPAAFFDFDRTLVSINSAVSFARYEVRAGRVSRWQFFKTLLWGALYHFDMVDIDELFRQAMRHYKGATSEEMEAWTQDWFAKEVVQHFQPGALEVMDFHREQGHPLVLLTNNSCYLATIATEHWDFDDWLANVFPLDEENKLTGEVEWPLCYGEGKVSRAEVWSQQHNIDLDESYFYSDALSDLAMLERVSYPRVVNPDPRLRRVAHRRNWPVLDWRQKSS
jgi:HAD superfamily hydrolase (TIGR01490 family)